METLSKGWRNSAQGKTNGASILETCTNQLHKNRRCSNINKQYDQVVESTGVSTIITKPICKDIVSQPWTAPPIEVPPVLKYQKSTFWSWFLNNLSYGRCFVWNFEYMEALRFSLVYYFYINGSYFSYKYHLHIYCCQWDYYEWISEYIWNAKTRRLNIQIYWQVPNEWKLYEYLQIWIHWWKNIKIFQMSEYFLQPAHPDTSLIMPSSG